MNIIKVAIPKGMMISCSVNSLHSHSQKYTSSTSVFTFDAIARRIRVTTRLNRDMVMDYLTRVGFPWRDLS